MSEEKKEVKKYTENDWRMDTDEICTEIYDVQNSIHQLEDSGTCDVLHMALIEGVRRDDRLREMLLDVFYAHLSYLMELSYYRMLHIDHDINKVRELEADL